MTGHLGEAARAHRAALAAQRALHDAAAARDQAVKAAIGAGHTQADIARALGVDRARVNKIAKGN